MRQAHDVAAIRATESAFSGQPGVLMERAAAGLAATCARLLGRVYGSRVVVLVGSGDNGGDALLAGALLAQRGAVVEAILVGSRTHVAGLEALRAAGGRVRDVDVLAGADLVLDGIVGIGAKGGLRPEAAAIVVTIPATAIVVAVDVPSGVDADTGTVDGVAVRAHATVTFGTWKPGLLVDPGAQYAGAVELVEIGLSYPTAAMTALQGGDVAALLPAPSAESDKYRRGVLGIVAGSAAYPGAAVLATGGALRAGAGMVRFVSVAHPAELVRGRWPEAVVTVLPGKADDDVLGAGRVQAWVIGPGIGTDARAAHVLEQVLSAHVPVIVDADALTIVGQTPQLVSARQYPTVVTPHAGELTRLLGLDPSARSDVEANRLHYARETAMKLRATVLLKGSTTVVCEPVGLTRVNPTGTPWLATAGSGDVLSGIVGALLAGGLSAFDAASCGAYLHGAAGRIAAHGAPIVADDIIASLAEARRSLS